MDNAVFLSIIFTFILHVTPKKFDDLLVNSNWKLVLLVFIEVFYDILHEVVKSWIINRVSFYFVLCLYGGYYLVFDHLDLWTEQLTILFCLRFVSFILETVIDVCIDLELDHDLADGSKIHSLPSLFCCLKEWNSLETKINIRQGLEYKGSVCVWVPIDVRECDDDKYVNTDDICCKSKYCAKSANCRWFHYILWVFAVPIIVPIIMGAGLLTVVISLSGKLYTAIYECRWRWNERRSYEGCCRTIINTPTMWREFGRRDV